MLGKRLRPIKKINSYRVCGTDLEDTQVLFALLNVLKSQNDETDELEISEFRSRQSEAIASVDTRRVNSCDMYAITSECDRDRCGDGPKLFKEYEYSGVEKRMLGSSAKKRPLSYLSDTELAYGVWDMTFPLFTACLLNYCFILAQLPGAESKCARRLEVSKGKSYAASVLRRLRVRIRVSCVRRRCESANQSGERPLWRKVSVPGTDIDRVDYDELSPSGFDATVAQQSVVFIELFPIFLMASSYLSNPLHYIQDECR
ncbi:hypothetical protein F2P81_002654 [Scophthalmus maximus]|uniref:Uncharacterized protein n=1 Tax=Scophthalmus maximus TaxID=52904 RepID=A0A6A4TLI5_SCOMX|nr:hypothetical protein F2P81_002654 [Scophthalmus maximus]